MRYSLRDMSAARKFSSALTVDVLHHAIPPEAITAVLDAADAHEQRERKLSQTAVVWLLIAMNLFSSLALDAVLAKLVKGLRYVWPDPTILLPSASAITYRRYQLGARPLVALYKRVCRPIATAQTRGAFRFGYRLMAVDGTIEEVPDTPANAAYWGRQALARGTTAYPQVQAVYLLEAGTHAIVDAGFWPYAISERVGGKRLLRSVDAGMLVMWDRGFHSFDMLLAARQRGAQVLSRLPATVHPEVIEHLADGSLLAYLYPSEYQRRRQGERMLVRVIRYTVSDPRLVGYQEEHRLITTLLDVVAAPALELAASYHERWESENVIDELDTHQRIAGRVLRSESPVGVVQELYGLLLAHYAVRVLMHEAACQAEVDPDRVSFVRALELIRDAIPEFQITALAQVPQLLSRLLTDMTCKLLLERQPRLNPRVVKRKISKFKLKRPEHRPCPPLNRPFDQALVLI